MRFALPSLVALSLVAIPACGSSDSSSDTSGDDAGQGAPGPDGASPADGSAPADASTRPDAASSSDSGGSRDAGSSDASSSDATSSSDGSAQPDSSSAPDAAGPVPDPNLPGPYTYAEIDSTTNVTASGDNNVAIHCAYPTSGPTPGPYPVIVVGPGTDVAASEYYGYVQRLASFGYVALTVAYPVSIFAINNPGEAEDMLGGLAWAASNSTVSAIADTSTAGMTGHSLGGKLALLAATMDSRVKASIVLDPVDNAGGQTCTAPDCVDVANMLPSLHIPTGFLGETTDSTGGVLGMPCAPAADNFTTFYAQTNSPSLEVTVAGAYHMSFLDDTSTCGFECSLCTAGTASNATVNGMAHAYVAAFYERWIRGNTGYDTYLTGAEAQARYVATSEATIVSK